ncbi:uncharacterized protein PG986_002111 [Apiospora aurea]|uniref:Uncharacterized protein n=1 Tax=Apiospora aurea TaxID=335848 RepID=A0ABR1QYY4_9PEZI
MADQDITTGGCPNKGGFPGSCLTEDKDPKGRSPYGHVAGWSAIGALRDISPAVLILHGRRER